jgi:hypothetical protein
MKSLARHQYSYPPCIPAQASVFSSVGIVFATMPRMFFFLFALLLVNAV